MPWWVEVIKIYNFLVDKSLPAVVFKGEDNWILWSDERAITDCINHVLKIEYSKSPKVQTNRWSILFRYFREHHQADLEDNISTHGLAVGDYGLLVLALHILSEKLQLLRFSVKSFTAFEISSKKFFFFRFWDFWWKVLQLWRFSVKSFSAFEFLRFLVTSYTAFEFLAFSVKSSKFYFKCFRIKTQSWLTHPSIPAVELHTATTREKNLSGGKRSFCGFLFQQNII